MVFSSLPIYLDPLNWNQPNQQMNINPPSSNNNNELIISPSSMITNGNNNQPPQYPNPNYHNPRPESMSERGHHAKIPQPEPALNCPRCDSTNTKFCYFNNYSLSQPRHFCKTCRRYWTRGGALRSVPVGGGCRRKRSSKKLQGGNTNNNSTSANSSTCSNTTSSSGSTVIPSNLIAANPQLNFLSSMHPFGDLGLNFTMMPQPMDGGADYQLGMQQYPFLGGINYPNNFSGESSTSGGGGELGLGFHLPMKVGSSGNISSGLIMQMASVKVGDGVRSNGLSRQYLGIASGNDQYLGGGWVGDLSGFNSSTAGNML